MEVTVEDFIRARSELCARIADTRAARFNKPIKGAEFDDQGMEIEEGGIETPPMLFHLIYSDAAKNLTGRTFKLNKLGYSKNNDLIASGPCFLRHKYRGFHAKRIVELTDLSTGEVFDDGEAFFTMHPLLGLAESPKRTPEEDAILNVKDELIILSLLAAIDGEFHSFEFDFMVKFVIDEYGQNLDENLVSKRLAAFVPDDRAFSIAIARLKNSSKPKDNFFRTLKNVANADDIIQPEEARYVHYVQSQLVKL